MKPQYHSVVKNVVLFTTELLLTDEHHVSCVESFCALKMTSTGEAETSPINNISRPRPNSPQFIATAAIVPDFTCGPQAVVSWKPLSYTMGSSRESK